MAPAVVALCLLGGLLRQTVLQPSITTGLLAIGVGVVVIALAAGLRTLLLIRQFGPSMSSHREPCGVWMMPPAEAFRVATYNVHACIGRDGRHDPNRVAKVIEELDADVVALQEFTYPGTVALETRTPVVLTTLDRYQCALGPTRQTMSDEWFGNALLTRHPIVDVHRLDISIERRERRGALAATIDVGGTLLHVLAAHLGLRIPERRFQVRRILEYLDSVRNEFFIVLGDFNDWLPGRSVVHVLDERLGQPPRPASFPVYWPMVPLDRILGSSADGVAPCVRTPDACRPPGVGSSAGGGGNRGLERCGARGTRCRDRARHGFLVIARQDRSGWSHRCLMTYRSVALLTANTAVSVQASVVRP